MSGVTVQDNKYVFVRGLGERYTTSSLNGARVPSPEPEKRVVPLDMFPAGLASVDHDHQDIHAGSAGRFLRRSRRHQDARVSGPPHVSLQLGGGYAAGTTGSSIIAGQKAGGESLGMVNARTRPSVAHAVASAISRGSTSIRATRTCWSASSETRGLRGAERRRRTCRRRSSVGGNDPMLFGHRIGYLLSGTYSSGTDFRDGQVRALADRGNTPGRDEGDRPIRRTAREPERSLGRTCESQHTCSAPLTHLSQRHVQSHGRQRGDASRRLIRERRHSRANQPHAVRRARRSLAAALRGASARLEKPFEWAGTASGVSAIRAGSVGVRAGDRAGHAERSRHSSLAELGQRRRRPHVLRPRREQPRGKRQLSARLRTDQQNSIKIGGLIRARIAMPTRAPSRSAPTASATRSVSCRPRRSSTAGSHNARHLRHRAVVAGRLVHCARPARLPDSQWRRLALSERFRLIGGARYESDQADVNAFSTLGSPVSTKEALERRASVARAQREAHRDAAASPVGDRGRSRARNIASCRRSRAATCSTATTRRATRTFRERTDHQRRHPLGVVPEERRGRERRIVRQEVRPADRARVSRGWVRNADSVLHERRRAPRTTESSSR